MKATFPYYYTEQPVGELVIPNIGDCAILANDYFGNQYVLIIRTVLGVTGFLEYGPYKNGNKVSECVSHYFQIDYNEKKIYNTIEKFLNTPRRGITQAAVYEDDYKKLLPMLLNPVRFLFDEEESADN